MFEPSQLQPSTVLSHSTSASYWLRITLPFVLAGGVVFFAYTMLFAGRSSLKRRNDGDATTKPPGNMGNIVAFNAVVFIFIGLAASIAAAQQWACALLTSGGFLLLGSFFGLLFGYPQGVADANANALKKADAATTQQPLHGKNLIAESASTLGKFLAGFTVAKGDPLIHRFHNLCNIVGPALCPQIFCDSAKVGSDAPSVVAGAIILYFFSTGFFTGLLLPPYFMNEVPGDDN